LSRHFISFHAISRYKERSGNKSVETFEDALGNLLVDLYMSNHYIEKQNFNKKRKEKTSIIKLRDGILIGKDTTNNTTIHLNVIPVKTTYQLDIYTKKRIEADEYVRQYLFKLINNPQIIIEIPYNNYLVHHTANLRVLDTVSDTSDIPTHVFPGQFYKWTIQLELQDGFLFSIPTKRNWKFIGVEVTAVDKISDPTEEHILFECEVK
jgi:hypothetical protein